MTQTAGQKRKALTPDAEQAWRAFSKTVFSAGELDAKTKQLIAVAVAHVTQVHIVSTGTCRPLSVPARRLVK